MTTPQGRARDELVALYAEFDAATERVAPVCRASGRCCDFPVWGHTLFASRLEADVLAEEAPEVRRDGPADLCPWWKERRCTARAPRPLGCRAFFCDASREEAMGALHEEFLLRLKDLHVRHGLPWDYRPLLRHLRPPAPGDA